MGWVRKRGNSWQAGYKKPDGRDQTRTFARKADAVRWYTEMEAAKDRGDWFDPANARRLFGDVAREWRASLVLEPGSLDSIDNALKNHILPAFEKKPVGTIVRSHVQAWVKDRSAALAPTTLEVYYRYLGAIFHAAMADGIINRTPCMQIKLPAVVRPPVVPMTTEQVSAVMAALPARYRGLVFVGAGAGLRPSEATGLTVPWIHFLQREIRVEQQLYTPAVGDLFLKCPKRGSVGTVPIGEAVLAALARHFEDFPPSITMRGVSGQEELLVFTDDIGRPIRRQRWNETWNKAARTAGLPPGMTPHDLRHYFASLLISKGGSVKAVQTQLRHKAATETLETYAHLWPDDNALTRRAVDAELGPLVSGTDDPLTSEITDQ